MGKGQDVAVIAIDLTKAFDSICHNLLLAKLRAYGLTDSAVKLMTSYLTNRKQRTKANREFSKWSLEQCGVPQGSLLGPLLFNIFINDLNGVISESSLRLYADDMNGYNSDVSPMVLNFSLNKNLGELHRCLEENYVLMNFEKTQSMILGKSNYNYELQSAKKSIPSMDILRILGMTLDKKLSFKEHVREDRAKACAKIGALRRLKRIIPANIAVRMYKTFVLPQLEYCNPVLLGMHWEDINQ